MKIVFYDAKDYEINYLKANCPNVLEQVYVSSSLSVNEKIEESQKNAEFISVFTSSSLSMEVLSQFENLKYIMTRSVGFNHIDLDYCKRNDIKVFNCPHYGDNTVAEFAFGLLLSAIRKIPKAKNAVLNSRVNLSDYMGIELYSKTIGIIGLGKIGQRISKIAQGFSMNVLVYDIAENPDYKCVSLHKLIQQSDIITLHCPLNENTKHLLSQKEFEMMKTNVVILNTARGEIIDTKALIEALNNKKIAYACLDVVECEDITCNLSSENFCTDCVNESCLKKYLLNRKLLSFENVIITPHIAYNTKEAIFRIMDMTIENIKKAIKKDFNFANLVL